MPRQNEADLRGTTLEVLTQLNGALECANATIGIDRRLAVKHFLSALKLVAPGLALLRADIER